MSHGIRGRPHLLLLVIALVILLLPVLLPVLPVLRLLQARRLRLLLLLLLQRQQQAHHARQHLRQPRLDLGRQHAVGRRQEGAEAQHSHLAATQAQDAQGRIGAQ